MRYLRVVPLVVAIGLVVSSMWFAFSKVAFAEKDSVVTEIRIDETGVRVGTSSAEATSKAGTEIEMRTISEDIVRVGQDIVVDEDQIVEGDVVAIGANVVVNGVVEGDAVTIGGVLRIGAQGEIDGDAVAIGGTVQNEEGGVIRGETVSLGWGEAVPERGGMLLRRFLTAVGRLILFIVWVILLILLSLLIFALLRKPIEVIGERIRTDAFKMGLIGLLAQVVFVGLVVIFGMSIIGIPIALIVLPIVMGLSTLFGFVAVSYVVGQKLLGETTSSYASLIAGVVLVNLLILLGAILAIGTGVADFAGGVLLVIGFAIIYVVATIGLGAVVMSRFGTKPLEVTSQSPIDSSSTI